MEADCSQLHGSTVVHSMVLLLLAARFARLNTEYTTEDGRTVKGKQTLPTTPWMTEHLKQHNVSWDKVCGGFTDKLNRRGGTIDCTILADVVAGKEFGGHLTPWNNEETYLWKYFAESPDCFSLRCRKFVTLEKALVVSCPPRLSRPTWSANNVPLQDLCAAAGMPAPEICNQLHVSQQDLEAFLRAPICMQLHALFMLLMRQQGWSTLMCRVSWMPGPRVGRHECEQHSMFFSSVGLPTEAFRERCKQLEMPKTLQRCKRMDTGKPLEFPWTEQAADRLLLDMRRWAPMILQQCNEDDVADEHVRLEEYVARLSSFLSLSQAGPARKLFKEQKIFAQPKQLLSAFFASMRLRNRSELPQTLALALRLLPGFQDYDETSLQDIVPSGSKISRSMLLLDVAYVCYWQERLTGFNAGDNLVYLWLDSSPQGGVDWLLSIMRFVKRDQVQACVQAAAALELSVDQFRAASDANDLHEMIAIMRARHRSRRVLDQNIFDHRLIPSGIGSGAGKAEDKLSSLCRKLFAETQSLQGLKKLLGCIRGFCTDAGAEMTVGDVAGVSLRDILPEWMQEPLEPEAGEDELDMNSARNPLNSNESSDYVFPCAIISPGALHILHNMTREVDESLEFYAVWLGDFKQLVYLLHDDHLRNRLIGTCIVGRHEWMKPLVRKLAEPTLWRWNAVVQILNNLVKCKGVLQAVWSAELFSHDQESGGQASGSQLDIPALTRIIGCEKFWLLVVLQHASAATCNV